MLASRLSCAFACTALLCIGSPRRALAGPEEEKNAAQRFHEGERAYAAGDYRKAAEAFELAYAASPHHAPLWNAARARERSGEPVRAANLLEKYLHDAPTGARDRDQATVALAALSSRLGRVEIRTTTVTQVRIDEVPSENVLVYVTPGEHIVTGSAGDAQVRKIVRVQAGEVVSVSLAAEAGDALPVRPAPEKVQRSGLPIPFFIAATSLTVIGATFVAISGFDTVQGRNAFIGNPSQESLDAAFSAQTRTNVLIASTAVLGLAAITIAYFTQWRSPETSAARAGNQSAWFIQHPAGFWSSTPGVLR